MNIVIAGGRDFNNYDALKECCMEIINVEEIESPIRVICGMARGADSLGKQFAEEAGFDVIEMPADWNKHGRKAGPIRNREMAVKATEDEGMLIAFWDGKSSGTRNMIDLAKEYKMKYHVITYE